MPSAITLTVSNLPTSTSFFLSALQPLDYTYRGSTDSNATIAFGSASKPDSPPDFWLTQEIPGVPAGAAHVAFPAGTRIAVQQFFNAALKAGAKVHGEPAVRDASGYYSAAVIDFDGNSIEAVYRPNHTNDNKENIPHEKSMVTATKTEISRVENHVDDSKVEASKAPSSSPKVQTAKSGDVIDVATNLARNVVQNLRPGSSHSSSSTKNTENSENRGTKAIVGTIIGVAAGAALSYAFGNKDKEKNGKERNAHRPLSPPRSSTYPAPTASRYHSSSDLPNEPYQYTQSPLAIEAPPFPRRRSSSCTASSRREMNAGEVEYSRRRRGSSAIDGHGSSRRSRRSSMQANDAPTVPPPAAPSTTSKHSRRSHSSKHHKSASATDTAVEDPSHHSPRSRRNSASTNATNPPSKRDRTSYPPSSFSPTTKSRVESAAGAGYPLSPSRAHTFDAAGPTDTDTHTRSSPKSTTSATTVKPAAPTREKSRRSSRRDSHSRAVEDPPPPPPPASSHRKHHRHRIPPTATRRSRADTWHGNPAPNPNPNPAGPGPGGPGPTPPYVTDPLPKAPDPLMLSRRSRRASNAETGGGAANRHRSRRGSMRVNRVVGVDPDPDLELDRDFDRRDFFDRRGAGTGTGAGAGKERVMRVRDSGFWESGKNSSGNSSGGGGGAGPGGSGSLNVNGLKGGIMDKEVTPDESISQVSTNY